MNSEFEMPDEETLEQACQRFNEHFTDAASPGLASVALPRMFIPGAPLLDRLAEVGVYSGLLQPEPQGLVVMLQRYPDMRADDFLEVFWHGRGSDARPLLTAYLETGQVGCDIPFYLPSNQVVEGIGDLYCRITRNAGQEQVGCTTVLEVLCKPTLPGGPGPTPDTAWHGGLEAPVVDSQIVSGESAWALIKPWLYMQAGGLLQLAWGNQLVEYCFADDQVGQPLRVEVPAAHIANAGDRGQIPVRYRIIDVVGDVSEKWSAVTWVSVQLQPGLGDAPRVDGAIEKQQVDSAAATVRIMVWASCLQVAVGDEIELVLEGFDFVARPLSLDANSLGLDLRRRIDETGKGYLFEVPAGWLAQLAGGWLTLACRYWREGQVVARSGTRYLEVSGALPGLPFADPSADFEGRLDPAQPSQAVVVRYFGLAYGDRVKLCWQGFTANGQPYVWEVTRRVSRADAGRGQLVFLIPPQHLEALDGGSLQLRYSVECPGPAAPRQSPRLWLQVGQMPVSLPAPQVVDMDEDNDVRVVAGQPVKVRLDYPDRHEDDQVTLILLGVNAAASIRLRGHGQEWSLPAEVLAAGLERLSELHYRVTRQSDQQVRQSATVAFTATAGVPLQLGAPQVMEANAKGCLDPSQIPPQGATVLFQGQAAGLRPGDSVRLHVTGAVAFDSQPLIHDPDQPQSFLFPARLVTASLNRQLIFTYSVTRAGRERGRSKAVQHAVRYQLRMASDTLNLNGLSVKYGWPAKGLDSIGNTAVRTASGGSGACRYVSSKPTVASVDPRSGKVTGNANGKATITATDDAGTQVSYLVNVSNVWNLNLRTDMRNPKWSWPQAIQWMNSLGGSPVTAAFIADMQRVYGAPLPLPRYIWNCVKVSSDAGMFYHHAYAFSGYFCSANTPNTNIYGGMCVTPRNG